MAGAKSRSKGIEPHSRRRVSQPWTVPGTATEKGPTLGMEWWPAALNSSRLACDDARPLPFRARTDFSCSFHVKANTSPPTPVELGSTTFSVAAVQIAASTALPPSISTCNPATEARGWLVATIPLAANTVERRESKYMRIALPKGKSSRASLFQRGRKTPELYHSVCWEADVRQPVPRPVSRPVPRCLSRTGRGGGTAAAAPT